MHKYYFFLDETGNHGLTYVDPNFPLFLLCGCLFNENELLKAKEPYISFEMVKEKIKWNISLSDLQPLLPLA
ncbi:MAG: hypothetical protein UU48_C0017G0010 [Candidatus Uhrbacteria bacterium GW2011_GWF2_41_16]|uniref:DUF3800 domain-containing protein n=1 Tax=Candidatus Uhrbacteria bacterium GW2011_GWF2_41_16 TaxID=1618997 RepID=A0A0G0V8U0_9BACT|nr:MAG: hypothetical protein UU48_C0017G0010 [Candidatus Uhrbacteria bacterium GW2011_GWF2_41_16]OHB36123.1 MAG: hypothetical protein A2Y09_10815 [Planctomycetes bacterium GWA2_39_15]